MLQLGSMFLISLVHNFHKIPTRNWYGSSLNRSLVYRSRSLSSSSSVDLDKSKNLVLLTAVDVMELLQQSKEKIILVDGSWGLEKDRNYYEEYVQKRIPGSVFFDIEDICDKSTKLPHMLPSSDFFSRKMSELGISSDDHVIVYTSPGCFSAARVWWTFRAYQHKHVSILNGGLNAWIHAGGDLLSGEAKNPVQPGKYTSSLDEPLVYSWQQVLSAVSDGSVQIADGRSTGRFLAQQPEPRPNVEGGHIPGSLSLPFSKLLVDNDYTTFKSKEEMKAILEEAGIVIGAKVVTTCGSGVSAAVISFALHLLGQNLSSVPIYDGSWSEWGSRSDLPKQK